MSQGTPRRELIDRFGGGTRPAAHHSYMGCRRANSQGADGRRVTLNLPKPASGARRRRYP